MYAVIEDSGRYTSIYTGNNSTYTASILNCNISSIKTFNSISECKNEVNRNIEISNDDASFSAAIITISGFNYDGNKYSCITSINRVVTL